MDYMLPLPLRKPLVSVALVLACAAASLPNTGCPARSDSAQRPPGHLSVPASGKVRIVTTKIKDSLDSVHWKWSVIGERNWTEANVSATTASLGGTYPLNSTSRSGGCHVWECDVIVKRTGPDSAEYVLNLHGSNGTTARTSGSLPSVKKGDALPIEPAQETDTLLRLPAELRLATVDGKPITFRIEK